MDVSNLRWHVFQVKTEFLAFPFNIVGGIFVCTHVVVLKQLCTAIVDSQLRIKVQVGFPSLGGSSICSVLRGKKGTERWVHCDSGEQQMNLSLTQIYPQMWSSAVKRCDLWPSLDDRKKQHTDCRKVYEIKASIPLKRSKVSRDLFLSSHSKDRGHVDIVDKLFFRTPPPPLKWCVKPEPPWQAGKCADTHHKPQRALHFLSGTRTPWQWEETAESRRERKYRCKSGKKNVMLKYCAIPDPNQS